MISQCSYLYPLAQGFTGFVREVPSVIRNISSATFGDPPAPCASAKNQPGVRLLTIAARTAP
ncbi:hypothetical protein [Pseudomonas sp. EL_65y_Pfl2_R95]|uniref:hypothetical protein n=1 Tax=Pseudomonas sp. EL_65y_Pfl2_R95 TaxID=3088698 RepID=UPI0030D8594E